MTDFPTVSTGTNITVSKYLFYYIISLFLFLGTKGEDTDNFHFGHLKANEKIRNREKRRKNESYI